MADLSRLVMPPHTVPIVHNGMIHPDWFRFLQELVRVLNAINSEV